MTNTALKALRESIAHWERLASGKLRKYENVGADHCALCLEFNDGNCGSCPVAQAIGRPQCRDTPFILAFLNRAEFGLDSKEFRAAARKELQFLKSLLPKKKQ